MIKLRFNPLNAEEVRAAHAVTMALMIQLGQDKGEVPETAEDSIFHEGSYENMVKAEIERLEEKDQEETAAKVAPELDARGMPWDARIHASTKTMLANGNWKNRRGVDSEELSRVENQLLGVEEAKTLEDSADTNGPEAPAEVTIEDVREVLAIKANANREAIRAELDRLGDESVTFMKKEHYAGFKSFLENLPSE